MARKKHDRASVSFHYLQRETAHQPENIIHPFSQDEFDKLCANIEGQPWPDVKDEKTLRRLRAGTLVPFKDFHRDNDRLALGLFSNAYTGHAFENSDWGKIEADSVNQRLFHYVLYLDEDGKIFVGTQYLGTYGGYDALRYGLVKHLPVREGVRSYSFRRELYNPKDVRTKEIRISIAAKSRDDEDNVLRRKRVLVLQRENRKDLEFERVARDSFLPIMASDAKFKRDEVVDILAKNALMVADDEEIKDCSLLADIDGREQILRVLGDSQFATKFSLGVPYNADGHPESGPTRRAMIETLKKQIIANLP
jgi:hypothetical protein